MKDKAFGLAILRMCFGLCWIAAAVLSSAPEFQRTFLAQVPEPVPSESFLVRDWLSMWHIIIAHDPSLYAHITFGVQAALGVCMLLGVCGNIACLIGVVWSLGVWSVGEAFGGPYIIGQSTDIGAAIPYALTFALLMGTMTRAYSLDSYIAPRIGPFARLCFKEHQDE